MRETLHQLGVTLALPIAVGAVWIARAERAEPPVRERATAYRVELAELPLPIRERLRPPGFAAGAPVARQAPEDAAAGRQRPALEVLSQLAPAPVDLAAQADSQRTLVAAPSPRAEHETTRATRCLLLRAAPPIALAAPSLSSRRAAAPASTSPSTASERPTPSPGKPVADRPASDADRHVPAPASAARRADVEKLPPSRATLACPGPGRARRSPTTIVEQAPSDRPWARAGIDPRRPDRFATPDGYRPLVLARAERGGLAPDLSPPTRVAASSRRSCPMSRCPRVRDRQTAAHRSRRPSCSVSRLRFLRGPRSVRVCSC